MADTLASSVIAVERAIDELRRGRGIIIDGTGYSPETGAASHLLITGPRAETLGLGSRAIRIDTGNLSPEQVNALADPTAPQLPSPSLVTSPAHATDELALTLAKYASLLPALFTSPLPMGEGITSDAIRRYLDAPIELVETARAHLPLEGMEDAMLISFRARHGASVHLALLVGDLGEEAPLVRVHSSCTTGDILGSLRCDCGDQLKLALAEIRKEGCGLLLYLHQEGRGIGLTNKLRAYQLQEQGFDTYEANRLLGFEEDERDFALAAAMLNKLDIQRIRLLTNNPAKLKALETAGITITERVPLIAPSGKHNHSYLDAKGRKAGHLL